MIEVSQSVGGSYCIDQTEITNAAYATWLATSPSDDLRTPDCRADGAVCQSWVMNGMSCEFDNGAADHGAAFFSYAPLRDGNDDPAVWPLPPPQDDFPVVDVTWCDANAFCAGNGKRLCGRIGGGSFSASGLVPDPGFIGNQNVVHDSNLLDPVGSEFANAMTHSGQRSFPYGSVFQPSACPGGTLVDMWTLSGELHAVGRASCEGGFPGLFDLEGNALEYIDAIHAEQGVAQYAIAVGDVAADAASEGLSVAQAIWMPHPLIGFRCCADTLPP
jgi:hypothetical protein